MRKSAMKWLIEKLEREVTHKIRMLGTTPPTSFKGSQKTWDLKEKDAIGDLKKAIKILHEVALFPQSYKNGTVCTICDNTQLVNGIKCPCINYGNITLPKWDEWDEWKKEYRDHGAISYNKYVRGKKREV